MNDFVKVTPTVAMRILELQEYRCALTGRVLTPKLAVLDHIVPLARGGEHSAANIWVLHGDVNRAKGKLQLEEFYVLCAQVTANREGADRILKLSAAGWHKAFDLMKPTKEQP